MEMDFRAEQFEHMLNWNYDSNRVHDIKLEEIMTAPYKTFLKAFEFLDLLDLEGKSYTTLNIKETSNILWRLIKQKTFSSQKNNSQINKVSPELLLSIIYNHRFEKKAKGRKKGSENIKSHYRKGISGDWVNYFNGEHKKYFKEKYNPLLVKLGYEIDHNW